MSRRITERYTFCLSNQCVATRGQGAEGPRETGGLGHSLHPGEVQRALKAPVNLGRSSHRPTWVEGWRLLAAAPHPQLLSLSSNLPKRLVCLRSLLENKTNQWGLLLPTSPAAEAPPTAVGACAGSGLAPLSGARRPCALTPSASLLPPPCTPFNFYFIFFRVLEVPGFPMTNLISPHYILETGVF